MAVNLISKLRNELSDEVIGRVASSIGESPANTQSAIGYALPATVGLLAQKAQSTQGAADLFGMLQRGGFDGTSDVSGLLKGGTPAADRIRNGASLVSSIFGARQSSITDLMASRAGIRPQSAASLLGLVAPFVMNMIGREASTLGGFNASSVARLLGDQLGFVRGAGPAGLASVLGLGGTEEPARPPEVAHEPARAYPHTVAGDPARVYDRGGGTGWLKWAIPLILLGLIVWGLTAFRHRPNGRAMAAATTPGVAAPVGTTGTRPLVKEKLSCGQELEVAPDGVERHLVSFIDDPNRSADTQTWFSFDRLEFETGSPNLAPASEAQVGNIAAILKCYPKVNLKFGGYTDNTGDPAANQHLSQARAEAARQAVVSQGIAPSRITAEGYGQDHPVASNATDEGRQRNRRVDVLVIKK
jgi:outer membrane protein OmpA-like peptidoglycan-associated protein